MEKIFYIFLACAFAGLLFYIHLLRRQVRRLGRLTRFYYRVSSSLGLMTVGYDVSRDTATLSPDCAQLFHLTEELPQFSRTREAARADASHPLHPVVLCLGAFSDDVPYQYLRRGEAPRRFLMKSFVLKDEEGRPYYLLGVFRDITQQANEKVRLVARAQFDGLTRIHNSGATRSWMREHIGRPRADGTRGVSAARQASPSTSPSASAAPCSRMRTTRRPTRRPTARSTPRRKRGATPM